MNETRDMWCPICGATIPITADPAGDRAEQRVLVDAQWAAHVCEIKGPGPRGFLTALGADIKPEPAQPEPPKETE